MSLPQYNPQSDELPLSDAELMALDAMLAALPSDAAMNIEALEGYLSALLLSPQPLAALPGETWIPVIWGGDDPFASGKQRKKLVLLVLRHLQAIACQLRRDPEAWEPIFSVADGPEGQEFVDAEDWCTGFMLGVDLAPEAWAPRFEDPGYAGLLAPIALLGGDNAQQDPQALAALGDEHQLDALSREVPEAVLALVRGGALDAR